MYSTAFCTCLSSSYAIASSCCDASRSGWSAASVSCALTTAPSSSTAFDCGSTIWHHSGRSAEIQEAGGSVTADYLNRVVGQQLFLNFKTLLRGKNEEQELQHQKSEANKLREQQKLAKAQLLEERRLKRVAAKEERERLAAEKALQREEDKMAKQLHKQLQSDIKLSQKGKKQSLKPAKATEIVVVDEIAHVVNEAAPQLTQRGRPIKPPTKLLM
jgi:hypothetical protein